MVIQTLDVSTRLRRPLTRNIFPGIIFEFLKLDEATLLYLPYRRYPPTIAYTSLYYTLPPAKVILHPPYLSTNLLPTYLLNPPYASHNYQPTSLTYHTLHITINKWIKTKTVTYAASSIEWTTNNRNRISEWQLWVLIVFITIANNKHSTIGLHESEAAHA